MNEPQDVADCLLIPDGHTPLFLDPIDASLRQVPLFINVLIILSLLKIRFFCGGITAAAPRPSIAPTKSSPSSLLIIPEISPSAMHDVARICFMERCHKLLTRNQLLIKRSGTKF